MTHNCTAWAIRLKSAQPLTMSPNGLLQPAGLLGGSVAAACASSLLHERPAASHGDHPLLHCCCFVNNFDRRHVHCEGAGVQEENLQVV